MFGLRFGPAAGTMKTVGAELSGQAVDEAAMNSNGDLQGVVSGLCEGDGLGWAIANGPAERARARMISRMVMASE